MERVAFPSTPPRALRVSVVVPVLDEADRIGSQLRSLARFTALHEVIVVDGGSRDETVARARAAGTARLLIAPRGRAPQMNAGARAATGDVLLFLHADVRLPDDALVRIEDALTDAAVVAGAFRTWTVPDGAGRSWLAPLLHLADLRSRYARLPYGDQALFVRAEAFRRVGGFPDQPLMEDLELSRRLARLGRLRVVRSRVSVSGRRFLARPIYYTLTVNLFPALYALGVAPTTLKRLYGDQR
jgi:rSAM/selenodomain-associated transferase 2